MLVSKGDDDKLRIFLKIKEAYDMKHNGENFLIVVWFQKYFETLNLLKKSNIEATILSNSS